MKNLRIDLHNISQRVVPGVGAAVGKAVGAVGAVVGDLVGSGGGWQKSFRPLSWSGPPSGTGQTAVQRVPPPLGVAPLSRKRSVLPVTLWPPTARSRTAVKKMTYPRMNL